MCIQFVYVNNSAGEGEYQVILANNRDEYYLRKTLPAHVWNGSCISGLDMERGREGGTWLGVNTDTGRIGSLLNILQNRRPDPDKRGRGPLVVDFINSDKAPLEYLSQIKENAADYNPFNLLLLEYRSGQWESYNCTSCQEPQKVTDGIYGVSNSPVDKPYQKVLSGLDRMRDITAKLNKVDQEEALVKDLMALLNDKTVCLPDPVLEGQAEGYLSEKLVTERSAVHVDSRDILYGTRTNTLILIEKSGRGKYIERTMREPVDVTNIVWDTNVLEFNMSYKQ